MPYERPVSRRAVIAGASAAALVAPERVAAAIGLAELKFGELVPTGTYLDMVANLPTVDPAPLTVPVMMIRGEYDGIATMDHLVSFFRKLPNGENRQLFWHAMRAFPSEPPVTALA